MNYYEWSLNEKTAYECFASDVRISAKAPTLVPFFDYNVHVYCIVFVYVTVETLSTDIIQSYMFVIIMFFI